MRNVSWRWMQVLVIKSWPASGGCDSKEMAHCAQVIAESMAKKHSIVVGLDIGTSKVCAVVGEMTERGMEIIGIGSHPSQGLRKGVVVNIESTVNSIKKAIEEAELMAGCEIHTVFTGLSGNHMKGFNSH